VLSPVVIAMWKPMAQAIGWGTKPVGWGEILDLARNPKGWAAYGHPEWGAFQFGHTHPEFSNSGLIALLAEVYAGAEKKSGLTLTDVQKPEVAQFLRQIEHSVVHYGSSTGFFGKKLAANGPQYLSAAVLYENMIIESYAKQTGDQPPLVAIYPKEGTFWSDHPVGIVEREWVTEEHREAAKVYLDYLLAKPQQEKALAYGFRPGILEVPLAAPIDTAHGVDPREPANTLEVPAVDVIDSIKKVWHENKKRSNVVLVLDISGSMNDDGKIGHAKKGALELVNMLSDEDRFSFLPFNGRVSWAANLKGVRLKEARETAKNAIESLFASDGTALYDAIDVAHQFIVSDPQPDMITAIIVLTDGEDEHSHMKLDTLLARLKPNRESQAVRVFTIGYGKEARTDVLNTISERTQAKFFKGDTDDILKVFKEISTFF
jgi:Ca-activated chloride channel family protein